MNKKIIYLLFLFCIFGCTTIPRQRVSQTSPTQKKEIVKIERSKPIKVIPKKDLDIQVKNVNIKRGEVIQLVNKVNLDPTKRNQYRLNCKDKNIPFVYAAKFLNAVLSESYFSKLESYHCYLSEISTEKKHLIFRVNVKDKVYPMERLNVDKKRVFLSKKDAARAKKEYEMMQKIYRNYSKRPLFKKTFIKPLNSFITSYYGKKRIFNGKKSTQHLGTDFRAQIGTKIITANDGKVVFAGHLFYAGNSVVIDHGFGVFTMYGHLSNIKVKKGDFVSRGQTVGLSGMTGRVNGPHLHWGVKVHGEWIDGLSLTKLRLF